MPQTGPLLAVYSCVLRALIAINTHNAKKCHSVSVGSCLFLVYNPVADMSYFCALVAGALFCLLDRTTLDA